VLAATNGILEGHFVKVVMKSGMTARSVVFCFAAVFAAMLLVATLVWCFPCMLWDHLELAPMYQGWIAGHLDQTTFWKLQGTGHWHIATYALLLPSAWLTHGHPWLDCVLSWTFLVAFAGILLYWRERTLPMLARSDLAIALLMVFLALYPGHFFNLQMGWQLAVFQCLFGAAVTIGALSAQRLTWPLNLLAIAGTVLGVLSFAVSYALFVIAFAMIFLRSEIKWPARILYFLPWLVLIGVVYHFSHQAAPGVLVHFKTLRIIRYTLYFLGGGIARFTPLFAPWIAAVALAVLVPVLRSIRDRQAAMPWFGLLLFASVGAALTAVGRGFLEPAQSGALVPRYVSFSIVFWIGWLGLLVRARADGAHWHVGRWAAAIGVLALVNAAQMTYEARELGGGTRYLAQTICRQWPNVDKSLLDSLIYSGADAARGDLQSLHDLGFAPFDDCTDAAPR
jgi:hypothetical protein